MNLSFFEKVVINYLFTKEKLKERMIGFINQEVFDDPINKILIKKSFELQNEFGKFPTAKELKLNLDSEDQLKRFDEALHEDLSGYTEEYLIKETEKFIRTKLATNTLADLYKSLNDGDETSIQKGPDQLRTAIGFSFDNKIGINILNEKETIYKLLTTKSERLPTGLNFIDKNIRGGIPPKTLTFFLAETNLGKSLILCSLATHWMLCGKKVLYVTLEMSEAMVTERIIANGFSSDINHLEDFTVEDFNSRYDEMISRAKGGLVVKEYPTSTMSVVHLRNLIRDLKTRQNFVPEVVVIDYLEIMVASFRNRGDNDYAEKKRISEEVRGFGVENNMRMITAWQANRGGFGSNELSMKDAADSIGPCFTGDCVFGVTQSFDQRQAGHFGISILKNRFGKNKSRGAIGVDYELMRIYDVPDSDQKAIVDIHKKSMDKIESTFQYVGDYLLQNKELSNADFVEWEQR